MQLQHQELRPRLKRLHPASILNRDSLRDLYGLGIPLRISLYLLILFLGVAVPVGYHGNPDRGDDRQRKSRPPGGSVEASLRHGGISSWGLRIQGTGSTSCQNGA